LPCQRREEGRGSWLACPFSAHKRRLPGRPWASAPTTIHDWRRPTERCLLNIFSDPHLNLLSVFHQIFLMDSLAKPVGLVESRRPAAPGVGPFQASWSCQEDKQSKPLVNNPSYTDGCTSSMEQIKMAYCHTRNRFRTCPWIWMSCNTELSGAGTRNPPLLLLCSSKSYPRRQAATRTQCRTSSARVLCI